MKKFKERLLNLWEHFTTYEICWLISIIGLSVIVTILFPSVVDDLDVNPFIIIGLYFLDIVLNVLCELLISKQSRWNFIVSLFVEITEIATLIVISERFATMAATIFFWIPCDIISFINWNKNKDKKQEELTVVRTLKGWQEVLIILGIAIWTIGVGYLLTIIEPEGILEADSAAEIALCYIDAFASAVGICNGLFILFRFREQWIAWYICTILETIMNIMLGQWVLLVLKAGYLTNTTYGYFKWTKYIKSHSTQTEAQDASNEPQDVITNPETLGFEKEDYASCENCQCCKNQDNEENLENLTADLESLTQK